jgi:GNAT superfamily N-acetyltransferase
MSKAKETKVTIRRMERSDIHEVLTLYRTIGGSERDGLDFRDLASANPGTMVPLTEVCIIHAILVHPDYQGRGIGRKLIQALLYHCQIEDIGTVRALIPKGNKELQALFERQGFQRSPIVNFDKTIEIP